MNRLLISLVAALLLVSCAGTGDSGADAAALYGRIAKAVEAGDYALALQLADSLDSAYTADVELRRKAMPLRAKANEGVALQRIPLVEGAIADAMTVLDQYGPEMVKVGEGAEYYMVPAGWPGLRDVRHTGIEPRVDSNANFRIVLKSTGKSIGLNAMRLSVGGTSVSSVPADASRVAVLNDSEMLSLTQEESAALVEWLRSHGSEPQLKAELVGTAGATTVQLTPAMAARLVQAWDFAMAQQQIVRLTAERSKLEKQLQIARDQQARLLIDNASDDRY